MTTPHARRDTMTNTGNITLPNGDTISAGQGGSYTVGSDTYPVTIVGWSKSGKTLYYRRAKRVTRGSDVFTPRLDKPVQTATWRARDEVFRPKGCGWSSIHTDGYIYDLDRGF
jgi:hypothetical protein